MIMNDIKFNCPYCKQSLEAPSDLQGMVLDCPSCSKKIKLPAPTVRTAPEVALQNVSVEMKRTASPLGIAALILGIAACFTCWIPFVGLLSIPLSMIGLLLGLIGIIVAGISKKTGFSYPISGIIICFFAVLIALSSTKGCSTAIKESDQKKKSTKQVVIDAPSRPHVAPQKETTESNPELKSTIEWANAANAVRQGDVKIQILNVRVGKVELESIMGSSQKSTADLLSIEIEVTNLSQAKKIDFTTWRGGDFTLGADCASLKDENENNYKRITFGASTPVGSIERESIYPQKAIRDVLIFEVPVDAAKTLRIEMPADNFGGEGKIRFEIPTETIRRDS
jgi:hypothetical protein